MKIRRSAIGTVVGLDLSLTGSAACALPCPWDGEIAGARQMPMAGYKLKADASQTELRERIIAIRDQILAFCKHVQAKHIMIENYAFSASGKITMLAELAGNVKMDLWENWGVSVEPIHASSARKILLQKLPQKDSKLFTSVNVRKLGGQTAGWTVDQIDAFCVANACLSRLGAVALSFQGEW